MNLLNLLIATKKKNKQKTKPKLKNGDLTSSETEKGCLPASMPCNSTALPPPCPTSAPCNALQQHLSKMHGGGHGNEVVPLFVLLQYMPSLTFVILFSLCSWYKQLQNNIWFQSLEPFLLEGLRNASSSDSIRHAGVVLCNLLWKLLLVAWQVPPSVQPISHILTYCYGAQLIKSPFFCYLNIQIISSDWLKSWLQMPYRRQILQTQILGWVFPIKRMKNNNKQFRKETTSFLKILPPSLAHWLQQHSFFTVELSQWEKSVLWFKSKKAYSVQLSIRNLHRNSGSPTRQQGMEILINNLLCVLFESLLEQWGEK